MVDRVRRIRVRRRQPQRRQGLRRERRPELHPHPAPPREQPVRPWTGHGDDPTGANGVDPRNGGIVGSVSYDTTRNELDPQYAASEDWQPGVSGVPVELHATVDCGTHAGTPCDANDKYELAPDGSYAPGLLLNTSYVRRNDESPKRMLR